MENQPNIAYAIYISGLIFKEVEKQRLSAKEQSDLDLWRLSSGDRQEMYRQLQDRQQVAVELRALNETYGPEDAVSNVFMTLGLDRGRLSNKVHVSRILRRSLTAAAFIILVMSAWYLGTRHRENPSVAISFQRLKNDIPPGGSKATLLLANGTRITLDSTDNDQLVRQGNVKVAKRSGKLTYQVTGVGGPVEFNTLVTPKGGVYQLVLPDGTKVWLNAASSLRYPTMFTDEERRVVLTGEAYFEVAHNAVKPFIVCKGNTQILVLGTHFNVNAYDDESYMKVTLLQGAVNVRKDIASVRLKPGQQADVANIIRVRNKVDTSAVVAWRNGYFHFDRASLQEVLKQLARWYDVEIIYSGTIPSREFVGEMERELNLSQALRILEQNKIHFSIQGKKIIVLP